MSSSSPIEFFEINKPYGSFSNYALYPVVWNGMELKSSEHGYQLSKFTDEWYREQIKTIKTPNMSRELASQKIKGGYVWRTALNTIIQESIERKVEIREDWDKIKDSIMYDIVLAKFTQNEKPRKLLLSTEEKEIVENSPYDSYWGCGRDKKGQNKLGKILMRVRDDLRK